MKQKKFHLYNTQHVNNGTIDNYLYCKQHVYNGTKEVIYIAKLLLSTVFTR